MLPFLELGIAEAAVLTFARQTTTHAAPRIFTLEIFFARGTDGESAAETLYFSTKAMVTADGDTPVGTVFRELIDDPGTIKRQIFGGDRSAGFVAPTWGGIVFKNADGTLDDWLDYATDGAKVTCRYGPFGGAYPAEYTDVYIAYIDGKPTADYSSIRFSLRGRERLFDEKVRTETFDGTAGTVNTIDLDGTGIADARVKPLIMGAPPPFVPVLLNEIYSVWYIHDATPPRITP